MILSLSSLPKTPSSQPIRADKTLLWQFGEDEDTIDGICGVHESIFTQQLRLQAPDDPNGTVDDLDLDPTGLDLGLDKDLD